MEFKDKLPVLRKQHGMTQQELSEKLGISRQAISCWERGTAVPSTENLISIGKLLGVSVDTLVNDALPLEERTAVAVAERSDAAELQKKPDAAKPRKKYDAIKIVVAVLLVVCIPITTPASILSIYSFVHTPEEPEEDYIWTDDMRWDDVDLNEVEDWTDSVIRISD